jgi:hypothetical protein
MMTPIVISQRALPRAINTATVNESTAIKITAGTRRRVFNSPPASNVLRLPSGTPVHASFRSQQVERMNNDDRYSRLSQFLESTAGPESSRASPYSVWRLFLQSFQDFASMKLATADFMFEIEHYSTASRCANSLRSVTA